MQHKPKRHLILKGLLKLTGIFVSILSLPLVRNQIWGRLTGKAQEKIVDAQARVVEDEKPKTKLFG